MKSKKIIFKCFESYKYKLLIILLFNIVGTVLIIFNTKITGKYVDVLTTKISKEGVLHYISVLILLNFAIVLFQIFIGYFTSKIQTKLVFEINYLMLKHIKKLSLDYFKDKDSFYVNQRINTDSNSIVSFFMFTYVKVATSSISLFILFYLLFKLDLYLALFVALCIAIFFSIYKITKDYLYKKTLVFKEAQNRLFSVMGQQLNNIVYIKLNVLYDKLDKIFLQSFSPFFKKTMNFLKINIVFSSTGTIINTIYSIFLYIYGGFSVIQGSLTIGEFIVIQGYYNLILKKVSELANILKQYPDAKVSYNRLIEILNINKEANGNKHIKHIDEIKLEKIGIKFNNKPLFNNVSCILKKGNIYLIDGENGVGKTTLLKCILGLYTDKIEGNIFFNRINIKEVDMYTVRKRNMSLVDQESEFFFDSIKDNFEELGDEFDFSKFTQYIKKFNLNISKSEVEINKKNCLSGGEKQKLAIIKSIIKSSDILFLDEPSSALDVKSVDILKKEILNFKNRKIIIIISHDKRIRDIADIVIKL